MPPNYSTDPTLEPEQSPTQPQPAQTFSPDNAAVLQPHVPPAGQYAPGQPAAYEPGPDTQAFVPGQPGVFVAGQPAPTYAPGQSFVAQPAVPQTPVGFSPPAAQSTPNLAEPAASQPNYGVPGQPTYSASPQTPAVAPPVKRKRLILAGVVVLAVCVLGSGGVLAYKHFQTQTPDQAFQSALVHALSTSSLTQTLSAGSNTATIKFDIAKPTSAKVAASFKVVQGSESISVDGYGTFKNTYIKIDSFTGEEPLQTTDLNKWIQFRHDGIDPAGDPSETFSYNDPDVELLGQYIDGNFSSSDRAALLKIVNDNKVYAYDASKVTSTKIGSDDVFMYKVTLNGKGLVKLDQKAAEIYGIDTKTDSVAQALASIPDSASATLYVSKSSHQLVKVISDGTTVTYGGFNHTTLPTEPTDVIQSADFASGSADSSSTEAGIQAKAKDTERKVDIEALDSHIEAYYAENGNYPTLNNLNDSNWMSTNMKGLDPEALQDPDGTTALLAKSPTKDQYSYQYGSNASFSSCDANISTCAYFKLTAILSDGTVYTKSSE